jgi:metal-responsive CopG/Arc/MetJ family transcriptional regulator
MEKNGKNKYTTVHIPTTLAEVIDEIIESERYAYSSRSEFIKDAIRRFLEYYSYYPSSKRNSKKEEQHVDLTQEDIASLLTRIVNKGTK